VNAIGGSRSCDGGTGYWLDTAILITWDDWGGWYDHQRPQILSKVQGGYERGFRVPMIVVSAYTPAGYINNQWLEFGAIARFIEGNFGVQRGALGFADARNTFDFTDFFPLTTARSYTRIAAALTAQFFLNDKRPPVAPDDD
jgi:phospholipase C